MDSISLNIGSLNCRGLYSDIVKRNDVLLWLKKIKLDIAFLVETHSTTRVEQIWKDEWGKGTAFFSSYGSSSRGVAILLQNTFTYCLHQCFSDPEGRYLFLDITIHSCRLTMGVVYGPNVDDPAFFENIYTILDSIGNRSLLLGGDWNVVQDYDLDTLNYRQKNNMQAHNKLINIMDDLDLVDIWRENNPDSHTYTWHGPYKKMSRLDYFLVSTDIGQICNTSKIKPGYRSDHSLILIGIQFTNINRGKGTWKFNNSLLLDEEYKRAVKLCINDMINVHKISILDQIDPMSVRFSTTDQLFLEVLKSSILG